MKHLTADPQLDGIPHPYRRVIERALYKDPRQRFSSVGEMVSALQLKTEKVSVGSKSNRLPPVVIDRPEPSPEPIYISDETADEIVFGPLVEVVSRADAGKPPVIGRAAAGNTPHEPIARAVRRSWVGAVGWWNTARLSSPVKVLLLVIGIFVLLLNASWLVPLAVVLGAAYLIYFGLRSLSLAKQNRGPSPATSPTGGRTAEPGRRRKPMVPVSRWQTNARHVLRQKTVSDRLGEITGSMLMSSLVASVLCIVLMAMSGQSLDGSVHFWSFFSWLLLTTLAGSWALLALGKFWERDEGESMQRRFVLLMTGLGVGAVAFALSQLLLIRPQEHQLVSISDLPTGHIPAGMYAADGTPQLAAYLIYFAGLFVVLRWWKLCDPLRRTQLSIWATVVTVVWALIMHVVWQFPQPWGFMIAAATAVTVQLSSSWMTTPQRARVRRELLEA